MKNYLLLILFLIGVSIMSLSVYLKQKKNTLEEIEYTIINNNTVKLNSDDHIITRISWTKNKNNYVTGVFDAANDPNFSDAVPIAIIKDQEGSDHYVDVNVPKFYKYLRYNSPFTLFFPPNDIFPMKLYGKRLSDIDANLKNDFQPTNLPLISIYTEESKDPESKEVKINCNVAITNEGKMELRENATIRVRGKSTSNPPKRPYSVKFDKKLEVLGLKGKYKKWNLIANFFDLSYIRNALAFKISQLMGFEYTPRCLAVDLILNGVYRGNYYLCDDVEIGKDRINIDEMKKKDITMPNITGGYFFEIDRRGESYGYENLVTPKGIKWRIKEPEEEDITDEQKDYIIQKMNQFEAEVYNGNFTNMDKESFSKFFLMDEYCGDPDEVWSNYYITKRRNDDKFYFGPVWDYDLSFDIDKRLNPINNKTTFLFYYGESAGTMRNFTEMLIRNKIIINYIKDTWEKLKSTTLNADVLIDFIEKEHNYIKESIKLDSVIWYAYNLVINPFYFYGEKERYYEDRETDLKSLKEYVKKRFDTLTTVINQAVSEAK
jgi:hypothetical protein